MQEKNIPAQNEQAEEEQLIEQARIRREKLAKLVAEGKNPYEQVKYPVDADSASIKANFEAYESKTVTLAGRMMSRRIMGKASFSHIADKSGLIQIYVTRQDIGEENYTSYKKDYDIGDIVGFKGQLHRCKLRYHGPVRKRIRQSRQPHPSRLPFIGVLILPLQTRRLPSRSPQHMR